MGLSAKEFHFYTCYRESLYRKWISMQILILKMPQTVILFKIASMILSMQKYVHSWREQSLGIKMETTNFEGITFGLKI